MWLKLENLLGKEEFAGMILDDNIIPKLLHKKQFDLIEILLKVVISYTSPYKRQNDPAFTDAMNDVLTFNKASMLAKVLGEVEEETKVWLTYQILLLLLLLMQLLLLSLLLLLYILRTHKHGTRPYTIIIAYNILIQDITLDNRVF